MHLKGVHLKNFRCFEDARFSFSPHFNLICGPNARGKTTILEAIGYFINGRSFRTSKAADLVRFGADHFIIEALFVKHGVEQSLKVISNGRQRKIICNHTESHSAAHLLGLLHGVCMVPDDIHLVKGGPSFRRDFLDLQIAQTDPLYVHHLMRYHRALEQRNTLLRAKELKTIELWEIEMAHAGAYLIKQRAKTINALNGHTQSYYATVGAEDPLMSLHPKGSVSYDSASPKEDYKKLFLQQRSRELCIGFTLSGPHKDDMQIALGGKEARFFASEGQQRSCIAAMRLAEWKRLEEVTEVKPLMLVDDLSTSLDINRRTRLMEHFSLLGQVFLTTTDEIDIPLPENKKNIVKMSIPNVTQNLDF